MRGLWFRRGDSVRDVASIERQDGTNMKRWKAIILYGAVISLAIGHLPASLIEDTMSLKILIEVIAKAGYEVRKIDGGRVSSHP